MLFVCQAVCICVDAQKMYRELCILMELRGHQLFAQLEDVIRAEGDKDLYCVFERMESDLHRGLDVLANTVVHRQYILYQIVCAMHFLHSSSIIHRDLKPSNILINWENCHVRICDFGLARSLADNHEDGLDDGALTTYVATRWYRAPELILGSSYYEESVDTWAVGCILGEMIRSRPMFSASDTISQLEKVLELTGLGSDLSHIVSESSKQLIASLQFPKKGTKIRDVSQMLGPGATVEEIDIVTRCLQFDPKKRPTMKELMQHSYFSKIRNFALEQPGQYAIKIPLDVKTHTKKKSMEEYRSGVFEIAAKFEEDRKIPLIFQIPQTAETVDTAMRTHTDKLTVSKETHARFTDSDAHTPVQKVGPVHTSVHARSESSTHTGVDAAESCTHTTVHTGLHARSESSTHTGVYTGVDAAESCTHTTVHTSVHANSESRPHTGVRTSTAHAKSESNTHTPIHTSVLPRSESNMHTAAHTALARAHSAYSLNSRKTLTRAQSGYTRKVSMHKPPVAMGVYTHKAPSGVYIQKGLGYTQKTSTSAAPACTLKASLTRTRSGALPVFTKKPTSAAPVYKARGAVPLRIQPSTTPVPKRTQPQISTTPPTRAPSVTPPAPRGLCRRPSVTRELTPTLMQRATIRKTSGLKPAVPVFSRLLQTKCGTAPLRSVSSIFKKGSTIAPRQPLIQPQQAERPFIPILPFHVLPGWLLHR